MSKNPAFALWTLPLLPAAGCSPSPPTSSTLLGRVAQETFGAPAAALVATAQDGARQRVALASDGSFELVLDKGKRYRLAVETPDGAVPVVFGGQHGLYLTSLDVPSGGATADLGALRYWANQPVRAQSIDLGATHQCVDGLFEGSGEPCIGEQASQVCADEDEGEQDGDQHECEDGLDPQGHACDGGPAANLDDGAEDGQAGEGDDQTEQVEGAVVVPEHGLGSLGCDDQDGDDNEDEGDDD